MAKGRYGGYNPSTQVGGFEAAATTNPELFKEFSKSLADGSVLTNSYRQVAQQAQFKMLDPNYKPTPEETLAIQSLEKLELDVQQAKKADIITKDKENTDTFWNAIKGRAGALWSNVKKEIPLDSNKSVKDNLASWFSLKTLNKFANPMNMLTRILTGSATDDVENFYMSTQMLSKGIRVVKHGENYYKVDVSGKREPATELDYKIFKKEAEVFQSLEDAAVAERYNNAAYSWMSQERESLGSASGLVLDGGSAISKISAQVVKDPSALWSKNWLLARAAELNATAHEARESFNKWQGSASDLEEAMYSRNKAIEMVELAKEYNDAWLKETATRAKTNHKDVVRTNVGEIMHTLKNAAISGLEGMSDFLAKAAKIQDTRQNVRSMVAQRLAEMNGNKDSLVDGTMPQELSKAVIKYQGKTIPLERDSGGSGSIWDIEKLVTNADGTPKLDNNGEPMYVSKYSTWDKLKNTNWSALGNAAYVRENIFGEAMEEIWTIPLTVGYGKIASMGGGLVNRIAGKKLLSKGFENYAAAFIQSFEETGQIARGARDKVMDEMIDAKIGGPTLNELADQVLKENPGMSESTAFLIAKEQKDAARESWVAANPELFSEIAVRGDIAFDTAAKVNSLSFLLDVATVKLFNGRVKASDNILKNPTSAAALSKSLGVLGKEALKEGVLEEAIFNSVSERAGIAAGQGKYYNYIQGAINWDSEQFESAMAGIAAGGALGTVGTAKSNFEEYKAYKQQQAALKELDITNPAMKEVMIQQMREQLNSAIQAEANKEIEEAISKGDFATARRIQSDSVNAQIIKHAQLGTLGQYIKNVETLRADPEVDQTIVDKTLRRAAMIGNAFDKYANTEGVDAEALMTNLGARATVLDQIDFLKKYRNDLMTGWAKKKLSTEEGYDEETEKNNFRLEAGVSTEEVLKAIDDGIADSEKQLAILEKTAKRLEKGDPGKQYSVMDYLTVKKAIFNSNNLLKLEDVFFETSSALRKELKAEFDKRRKRLEENAVVNNVEAESQESKVSGAAPSKPKPTVVKEKSKQRMPESEATEEIAEAITAQTQATTPVTKNDDIELEEEDTEIAAATAAYRKQQQQKAQQNVEPAGNANVTMDSLKAQKAEITSKMIDPSTTPSEIASLTIELGKINKQMLDLKKAQQANEESGAEATTPKVTSKPSTSNTEKGISKEVTDAQAKLEELTKVFDDLITAYEDYGIAYEMVPHIVAWENIKYRYGLQTTAQSKEVNLIKSELQSVLGITFPFHKGALVTEELANLSELGGKVTVKKGAGEPVKTKAGNLMHYASEVTGWAYKQEDGSYVTSPDFHVTIISPVSAEDIEAMKSERPSKETTEAMKATPAKKEVKPTAKVKPGLRINSVTKPTDFDFSPYTEGSKEVKTDAQGYTKITYEGKTKNSKGEDRIIARKRYDTLHDLFQDLGIDTSLEENNSAWEFVNTLSVHNDKDIYKDSGSLLETRISPKGEVVFDIMFAGETMTFHGKPVSKKKASSKQTIDTSLPAKKPFGNNSKKAPFYFKDKKTGATIRDEKQIRNILYSIEDAMARATSPEQVIEAVNKYNPISSKTGQAAFEKYLQAFYDYTVPVSGNNKNLFADWFNARTETADSYTKRLETSKKAKAGETDFAKKNREKRKKIYEKALQNIQNTKEFHDSKVGERKKALITGVAKPVAEEKYNDYESFDKTRVHNKYTNGYLNPSTGEAFYFEGNKVFDYHTRQEVLTGTDTETVKKRRGVFANYAIITKQATPVTIKDIDSKTGKPITKEYVYYRNGTIISLNGKAKGSVVYKDDHPGRIPIQEEAEAIFAGWDTANEPPVVEMPTTTAQTSSLPKTVKVEDYGYSEGQMITEDIIDKRDDVAYKEWQAKRKEGITTTALGKGKTNAGNVHITKEFFISNETFISGDMLLNVAYSEDGDLLVIPLVSNIPTTPAQEKKEELSSAPKSSDSDFGFTAQTRRVINMDAITPLQLASFKEAVLAEQRKLDKPGQPATFWDYLTYKVETEGRQAVFDKFSSYELGWSLTGRSVDYEDTSLDIHDVFFSSLSSVEHFIDNIIEFQEEIPTDVTVLPTEERKKVEKVQKTPKPKAKTKDVTSLPETEEDTIVQETYIPENFDNVQDYIPTEEREQEFEFQTDHAGIISAGLGVAYDQYGNDVDINIPEKTYLRDGNHNWWHPEVSKEGTPVILRPVPYEEAKNLLVTNYVETDEGLVQETSVPFGVLFPVEDLSNPDYIAKVPMKYTTEDGLEINWIHDLDWYNTRNVASTEEQHQTIVAARNNLFQLRKKAAANPNGIKGVISSRRLGGFTRVVNVPSDPRSQGQVHVPVSVMSPTSIMALATDSNTLYHNGKAIDTSNILNVNTFAIGQVYDLRVITVKPDGSKEYMAFPTLGNNPDLGEQMPQEVFETLQLALAAVLWHKGGLHKVQDESTLDVETKALKRSLEKIGMSNDFAAEIVESVSKDMGYDILNISNKKGPGDSGLGAFLDLFVHVGTDEEEFYRAFRDTSTYVNKAGETKDKFPVGVTHLYLSNNGSISIGKKDKHKEVTRDVANGTYNFLFSEPNGKGKGATKKQLKFMADMLLEATNPGKSPLRGMRLNVSKYKLGTDQRMLYISREGGVMEYGDHKAGTPEVENSYDLFVKDNRKTDVYARRVPNRQKPGEFTYVTDLQPIIELDFGNEVVPVTDQERALIDTVQQVVEQQREEGNLPQPVEPELPTEVEEVYEEAEEELTTLPEEIQNRILSLSIKGIEKDIENYQRPVSGTRRVISEHINKSLKAIGIPGVEGLTRHQYKQVINDLAGTVYYNLSRLPKVSNAEIRDALINVIPETIQKELEEVIDLRETLEQYGGPINHPRLYAILAVKEQKLQTIIDNSNEFISFVPGDSAPVVKQVMQKLSIKDLDYDEDLDDGALEHLHNQETGTKDVRKTFGTELLIFFSGVKKIDANNEEVRSFTGAPEYFEASAVIGALRSVMVNTVSSWDAVKQALKGQSDRPIMAGLLARLEEEDVTEKVSNGLLYNLIQNKFEMRSLMLERKGQGELETFVYSLVNPNKTDASIQYTQTWKTNYYTSEIIDKDAFVRDVVEKNKKQVQATIDLIKTHKFKRNSKEGVPPEFYEPIRLAFSNLGIILDDKTFVRYMQQEGANIISKSSILVQANNNYESILRTIDSGKEYFFKQEDLDVYSKISGKLKSLVSIKTEVDGNPLAKSIRQAGKTYQSTVQPMLTYQAIQELKDPDSEMFKAMEVVPYTSNNYLLRLLKNSQDIRNYFDARFVGPEALKELGTDNKTGKIQEQGPSDRVITELNLFAKTAASVIEDVQSLTTKYTYGTAIRIAHMFNSALSDKSNQTIYSTPVLDLQTINFDITTKVVPGTKGESATMLQLNNDKGYVLQLIREQVFNSELNRVFALIDHQPGINGYDFAGVNIIALPLLNEISTTFQDSYGNTVTHTLESAIKTYIDMDRDDPKREVFKDNLTKAFNLAANEAIIDYIDSEVWAKIGVSIEGNTTKLGTWHKANIMNPLTGVLAIDSKYLDKWGDASNDMKLLYTAYDFVINNLLHQSNQAQLISGDPAFYAPANPKKYKNSDGSINFLKLAKATGESLTKRMAQLIAPGSVLANAHGDRYVQIIVNDRESIADILPSLIQQMYGTEAYTEKVANAFQEYKRLEQKVIFLYNHPSVQRNEGVREVLIKRAKDAMDAQVKILKASFPDLEAYMSIEGTDAQEYTTWQEHFDTVFRQGRLDPQDLALLKSAYKKLQKNSNTKLDPSELHAVMTNPIKPVHAGREIQYAMKDDGTYDFSKPIAIRPFYNKSSSFPLLPQLTQGTRLDAVRQKMEILATDQGHYLSEASGFKSAKKPYRGVRLAYQTAAKVGGPRSGLTMDDLYYLPMDELIGAGTKRGKLAQSMIELSRENFRIQLDVPDKVSKHLKSGIDDVIIMGSQIWKMLMASGINHEDSTIFPNRFDFSITEAFSRKNNNEDRISGRDLDAIKTEVERKYGDIQRIGLYRELGLSPKGEIIDMDYTLNAVRELLKAELETKDYPQYIVDGIDLVETPDAELEFLLPLWMSPSTNKFESMLQAIVTNRLIKYKLPGYQHVSASAEGFERTTVGAFEELPSHIKSGIVYTNDYDGSVLKSSRFEDGRLRYSQILIKSHFRTPKKILDEAGNVIGYSKEMELIDLTQEPYSTFDEERGTYILNEKALPPNLREMFSFRIPTSSHQSGAMLEVVGFLPPGSGDTVVVPKEHTTQIGEDFDVDKRSLYKKHYRVNPKTKYISEYTASENFDLAKDFSKVDAALYNQTRGYIDSLLDDIGNYGKSRKDVIKLSHIFEDIDNLKNQIAEHEGDELMQEDLGMQLAAKQDEFDTLAQAIKDTYPMEDFTEIYNHVSEMLDITKQALEEFKAENRTTDAFGNIIPNPIYQNYVEYKQMLSYEKIAKKLLENAMIASYESVYTAESPEIQNKIMKILSMDTAINTAGIIDKRRKSDVNEKYFSIYSDEYQAAQVALGASGKLGISIHSNAVVNHARYERISPNSKIKDRVKFGFSNTLKSDGTLGLTHTLDGKRLISDVGAENQNSATDNVKAGAMGKRNENEFTLNAFVHLTKLGFDLNTDPIIDGVDATGEPNSIEMQVPSMLISQPIMFRYVELRQAAAGVTAEFNPNPMKTAIRTLVKEFGAEHLIDEQALEEGRYTELYKLDTTEMSYDDAFYALTTSEDSPIEPQKLFNQTRPSEATPETQLAALVQFLRVDERAAILTKIEGASSLNTSGLGKSYFNVINNLEILRSMHNNQEFAGIEQIVGEFTTNPPANDSSYTHIGEGIYVKPTTTEGILAVNALTTGDLIMDSLYPYKQSKVAEVLDIITTTYKGFRKGDLSKTALEEVQYAVMESLREYYFNSPDSGLFDGDIHTERERLFNNQHPDSLLNIIMNLKKQGSPIILENALIKDLDFVRDTASEYTDYSLVVNVEAGDIEDKKDKYDAYTEMLQDDATELLTLSSGEKLTPQKLALDLMAYAYLSRDRKGFTGLREFINVEVLKTLGFTDHVRALANDIDSLDVDNFVDQFFRHNPQFAAKFSSVSHKEEHFDYVQGELIQQKAPKDLAKLYKGNFRTPQELLTFNTYFRQDDPDNLAFLSKAYSATTSFSLADKTVLPPYMHFKPNKGVEILFKHVGEGQYVRIQAVPSKALNFYNTEGPIDTTKIFSMQEKSVTSKLKVANAGTVYSRVVDGDSANKAVYTKVMASLKSNIKTPLDVFLAMNPLQNTMTDPQAYSALAAVATALEASFDEANIERDTPLVTVVAVGANSNRRLAQYNRVTKTIEIRSDFFERVPLAPGETRADAMLEVMTEELMHAFNHMHADMYISENTTNGKIFVKEGAPEELKTLVQMYIQVREKYVQDEDGRVRYELQNFDEFVANAIASKSFRDAIDNTIPNFAQKFLDVIASLYNKVFNNSGMPAEASQQLTATIRLWMANTTTTRMPLKNEAPAKVEVFNYTPAAELANTKTQAVIVDKEKAGDFTADLLSTKAQDNAIAILKRGGTIKFPTRDKLTPGHTNLLQNISKTLNEELKTTGNWTHTNITEVPTHTELSLKKQFVTKPKVKRIAIPSSTMDAMIARGFDPKSNEVITIKDNVPVTKPLDDEYTPPPIENQGFQEDLNVYAGTNSNVQFSNFATRPFKAANGITYKNVESAFQHHKLEYAASMTQQPSAIQSADWSNLSGAEARSLGRSIIGLDVVAWDADSKGLLHNLMFDSFYDNPEAAQALVATYPAKITHKNQAGVEQDKGRFSELLTIVRDMLIEEGFGSPSQSKGISKPKLGKTPEITAAEWDAYYGTTNRNFYDKNGDFAGTLADKFFNPMYAAIEALQVAIGNSLEPTMRLEDARYSLINNYGFTEEQIQLLDKLEGIAVIQKLDNALKMASGMENSDATKQANTKAFIDSFTDPTGFLLKVVPNLRSNIKGTRVIPLGKRLPNIKNC